MKKTKIAAYTCSLALASAFAVAWASGKTLRADNETPDDPKDPIEGVEINEENFPDEIFRELVSTKFDKDKSGVLDEKEIQGAAKVELIDQQVTSLKGVEYLTSLTSLNCSNEFGGFLSELDLEKNTELSELDCSGNRLKKLDLSSNTKLKMLACQNNGMRELNISNCSELTELNCGFNLFEKLDLSACTKLENLAITFNRISELDLSNLPELKILDCSGNKLKAIDISKNSKLEVVDVSDNFISELDVSKCENLAELVVFNTSLKTLDCKGLKNLKMVMALQACLETIDVTDCENLQTLVLDSTFVKELDLSTNKHLKALSLGETPIKTVNLDDMNELSFIECFCSDIETLDFRKCETMKAMLADPNVEIQDDGAHCLYFGADEEYFISMNSATDVITEAIDIDEKNFPDPIFREYVSKNIDANGDGILSSSDCNLVTDIDVSGKDIASLKGIEYFEKLKTLSCKGSEEGGKLTELDVSKNTVLVTLDCSNQPLTKLDVSANVNLKKLYCFDTKITDLTLGENMTLVELHMHHSQIASIDVSKCQALVDNLTDESVKLVKYEDYYMFADEGGKVYLTFDASTKIEGIKDLPTPSPEPEKGATIGDFVDRLYTEALGRASEEAGKKYWVTEITSGRKTGGDCGLFFLTGEEFTNRKLSVEDFVETLYKTFFGRESEASGKAYWVGVLKNGGDRNAVVKGFIDSKEWCNLCADYGVRSGAPTAKAERASKNATDFATRLYTCCLGREAEAGGLKYWSLALTNLEQTGCSAAKEFFGSAEFVNLKLKDDEYVKRLYTTFMARDPQAGEVSYWAGEIKKGTQTRSSVLTFFGESDEFTEICAKYGIERGAM